MVQKKECAKCHRIVRPRSLVKYRTTGELRCRQCIHKYGQNPFYEPKIKGAKKEKKFIRMTLKPEEKIELWKSLTRIGIGETQAKERIERVNHYQYYIQRKRMLPEAKEQQPIDKTKFIEGLK